MSWYYKMKTDHEKEVKELKVEIFNAKFELVGITDRLIIKERAVTEAEFLIREYLNEYSSYHEKAKEWIGKYGQVQTSDEKTPQGAH